MNRWILFFMLNGALVNVPLAAHIIETNQIVDVLAQAQSYDPATTLIIFDIDNTIAAPYHEFGSDQWFSHHCMSHVNKGLNNKEAVEKTLPLYCALQHTTALYPVELTTPYVVRMLQSSGYMVIALTVRSVSLGNRTVNQLQAMHIDFTLSAPHQQELWLATPSAALYKSGIIFCDGGKKEEALEQFLAAINCAPKTIIFVDDKMSYLKAVEGYSERSALNFIGIRYGFCDERVRAFDAQIATRQFHEYLEHHINVLKHIH